jgi:tetratricopeptide (TPR) repeat protein
MRARVVAIALACIASCAVRSPAPVDVAALIRARGGDVRSAARTLEVRVVAEPGDVAAHLALAELDERLGRPSGALAHLEAVVALHGPFGTRWRAADRARLARLLAARGRARLARTAPTALADLTRARELGAAVAGHELDGARLARAVDELRHVDTGVQERGMRTLAALGRRGAGAAPTPVERGELGVWLWSRGARLAAYEELRRWVEATPEPRDPALSAAWAVALAWWTPPVDAPPPLAVEAGAALAATLRDALRGGASWGPAFAARHDPASATVPPAMRGALSRLAHRAVEPEASPGTDDERLVAAAGRALVGAPVAEVTAVLDGLAETPDGRALIAIVAPPAAPQRTYADAVVAHVRARAPFGPPAAALARVVAAYLRDPAIADRLADDVTAEAIDAAAARAALGALFLALEDPARARAACEAAVALAAEPGHVRALAETLARAGDPDAALVAAATAAAASGDPAPVYLDVARALDETGHHAHALEAARSALDLGTAETLPASLAVAAAASHALGRDAQAAALLARRPTARIPDDPTDAAAALAAHRAQPSAATAARLWVAARWNPRDVAVRAALARTLAPGDPRGAVLAAELAALAEDPALAVADARAAVQALRR